MTDKSIRDGLILTIRYWRKEADSFRENAGLLDAKGKAHQADLQGRTDHRGMNRMRTRTAFSVTRYSPLRNWREADERA